MSIRRVLMSFLITIALALSMLTPGTILASTVTLQQGVDGYSGCTDGFMGSGGYSANLSQNYGTCSELRVACVHYASW